MRNLFRRRNQIARPGFQRLEPQSGIVRFAAFVVGATDDEEIGLFVARLKPDVVVRVQLSQYSAFGIAPRLIENAIAYGAILLCSANVSTIGELVATTAALAVMLPPSAVTTTEPSSFSSICRMTSMIFALVLSA
jgi:hypothetical protein